MERLNEDSLQSLTIDFQELKSKNLNEGYYAAFGSMIKLLLDNMFGTSLTSMNIRMRGTEREIKSFTNALGNEKRYIQTARDYGLDNPRTYKSKAMLDNAIGGFEKVTGLKWPFK